MKWIVGLAFFLLITCQKKNVYREYVEIRKGGGKFGQTIALASDSGEKILNASENSGRLSKGLKWQVPKGWIEKPGNGVRLATLKTDPNLLEVAEVTLISFPGKVGGIVSNLKRWLKQIKIVLTEDELNQVIKNFKIEQNRYALRYILVDFEKILPIKSLPHQETILAAVVKFSDETLFVKMKGKIDLVNRERINFRNFIDSVRLEGAD